MSTNSLQHRLSTNLLAILKQSSVYKPMVLEAKQMRWRGAKLCRYADSSENREMKAKKCSPFLHPPLLLCRAVGKALPIPTSCSLSLELLHTSHSGEVQGKERGNATKFKVIA
jgi:hypothetical protein